MTVASIAQTIDSLKCSFITNQIYVNAYRLFRLREKKKVYNKFQIENMIESPTCIKNGKIFLEIY